MVSDQLSTKDISRNKLAMKPRNRPHAKGGTVAQKWDVTELMQDGQKGSWLVFLMLTDCRTP
jgi:hypothetical protein